jgi:anti-sigma regulatory factor (Ser/Thr protein kinase)
VTRLRAVSRWPTTSVDGSLEFMSTAVERFTATLAPDPALLRDFRHRLTAWLETAGVSDAGRDAILLAAHEAAANAIEHAALPATVIGRAERDVVMIEVTSAGRWGVHEQERSDERGRGLALMRGLLSEVEVVVEEDRTIVRLRLIRNEPG